MEPGSGVREPVPGELRKEAERFPEGAHRPDLPPGETPVRAQPLRLQVSAAPVCGRCALFVPEYLPEGDLDAGAGTVRCLGWIRSNARGKERRSENSSTLTLSIIFLYFLHHQKKKSLKSLPRSRSGETTSRSCRWEEGRMSSPCRC